MPLKMPGWAEPAVWGLIVGVVGCWLLLARGFGWMSPVEAARLATQKANDAVVAYATPVCVARFEAQPNAVAAWETLKNTDEWNRDDMLVKDGWVGEPGQKLDADTGKTIADACSTKILALKTLDGVQLSSK